MLRDESLKQTLAQYRADTGTLLGASISDPAVLDAAFAEGLLFPAADKGSDGFSLDAVQVPRRLLVDGLRAGLFAELQRRGIAVVVNSPVRHLKDGETAPSDAIRSLAAAPVCDFLLTGTRTHLADTIEAWRAGRKEGGVGQTGHAIAKQSDGGDGNGGDETSGGSGGSGGGGGGVLGASSSSSPGEGKEGKGNDDDALPGSGDAGGGGGLTALVTGGNRGIGLEVVKSILAGDPAATVFIGSRDLAAGQRVAQTVTMAAWLDSGGTFTGRVEAVQLDVLSDESIAAAAVTVGAATQGQLDILVNNAGVLLDGDGAAFSAAVAMESVRACMPACLRACVLGETLHCSARWWVVWVGRVLNACVSCYLLPSWVCSRDKFLVPRV